MCSSYHRSVILTRVFSLVSAHSSILKRTMPPIRQHLRYNYVLPSVVRLATSLVNGRKSDVEKVIHNMTAKI